MSAYSRALKLVKQSSVIAVAGHIHPDGDSIGSMLSLGLGLRAVGKKVLFLSPEPIPAKYSSLPGARFIRKSASRRPDLAIAVDCSVPEMLGDSWKVFARAKNIVEIDHHRYRRPFGSVSIVDHEAAAVGEMIHEFLVFLGSPISRDIALNILASILVETNSFRLPTVRPKTFSLCASLLRSGADFHRLAETVYWSRTRQNIQILARCLSRCSFMASDRLVWSILRLKDFERIRAPFEEADNVMVEMREIENVEVAVLFREMPDRRFRVSLRSRGNVDVGEAARHLEGGGHFDSAGFETTPAGLRPFLKKLEASVESTPPRKRAGQKRGSHDR